MIKEKSKICTLLYLYISLLIIPYFIIDIDKFSFVINKVLILLYTILCLIFIIIINKKINKLDSNNKNNYINYIKKGTTIILIYFLFSIFELIPLILITKDINSLPIMFKMIYLTICELLEVILVLYIIKNDIKKDFLDFKKNFKNYISKYTKNYIYSVLLMFIANFLIIYINPNGISGNEQQVRELLSKAPIYMIISATIIGPILEEIVFRKCMKYLISNKKVFIIASGIVFGLLHVINNINSPLDWLYLIPYSIPGFAFAYIFDKSDNIFTTIFFHMLHNGITILIQFLL